MRPPQTWQARLLHPSLSVEVGILVASPYLSVTPVRESFIKMYLVNVKMAWAFEKKLQWARRHMAQDGGVRTRT